MPTNLPSRNELIARDMIPENAMETLRAYIDRGRRPGGFMEAVLSNNLSEAVARADERHMIAIPAIVFFLYNEAPSGCWGTPERVRDWMHSGGLDGRP